MARLIILVSLSVSMALLSGAQPVVGVASGPGVASGFGVGAGVGIAGAGAGYGNGYPDLDSTNVPISPITISPETDILPVSNVQPIVNVFPTDFNDYSNYPGAGYGIDYGYDGVDLSGGYGYGGYGGPILGYN